ncbi:MAG: type IV toxin-antitoxin system AbiEi family antitoxin [Chitinophagaceae bacterium]
MEPQNIQNQAIKHLWENVGVIARWHPREQDNLDGALDFTFHQQRFEFPAQVRVELRKQNIPQLILAKKAYGDVMVLADYLPPTVKEEMRKEGINYIEANGNMYLKKDKLFFYLDGKKGVPVEAAPTGRAFTKTGLKFLFHLLVKPEWLGLTYRELEEKTLVGFGNLNVIINDLKEQNFIVAENKRKMKLVRKKELLQKWMDGYALKLKPKLHVGNFEFLDNLDVLNWKWENVKLNTALTCWGAEVAGAILTNYLKPEKQLLYTEEGRMDFIKNYRIIPAKDGELDMYRRFWNPEIQERKEIAPYLLVYADLMNTGDRRCMGAAKKIYDEWLQDKF